MQRQMPQPFPWNNAYSQQAKPEAPGPSSAEWQAWTQRLSQSELKLQQMTDQLTRMQKQLDELSSKPPLHVEYHFDQLKVNRLEGTLNVGMSPQGMPGIESFEAPDPSCFKINAPDQAKEPPIRELQAEMTAEMDTKSPAMLFEMERQFDVSLDADERQKVLADVKRQLNERVHYYARTIDYPADGSDEERRNWQESIKEKTRRDIKGAFSAYLSKRKQTRNTERG
ncbi:spore germination protein GerPC [Cohnella endophytica]|nr:spore germination protein GerPC [Cohnella endophytica]